MNLMFFAVFVVYSFCNNFVVRTWEINQEVMAFLFSSVEIRIVSSPLCLLWCMVAMTHFILLCCDCFFNEVFASFVGNLGLVSP
jgi:hypothetical protein